METVPVDPFTGLTREEWEQGQRTNLEIDLEDFVTSVDFCQSVTWKWINDIDECFAAMITIITAYEGTREVKVIYSKTDKVLCIYENGDCSLELTAENLFAFLWLTCEKDIYEREHQ